MDLIPKYQTKINGLILARYLEKIHFLSNSYVIYENI